MNECCKKTLEELLCRLDKKFAPLIDTPDPSVPMTAEQFAIFKVLIHAGAIASEMAGEKYIGPSPPVMYSSRWLDETGEKELVNYFQGKRRYHEIYVKGEGLPGDNLQPGYCKAPLPGEE